MRTRGEAGQGSVATDRRSQSEMVGTILLIGITIIGAVAIVAFGSTALNDTQSSIEVQRAEHAMTQLDAKAAEVALGDADVHEVRLPSGGTRDKVSVEPDRGWIRVQIINQSSGAVQETVVNQTLGVIEYENRDTRIAYQGGGVWKKAGNGSVMISPPEFHYRGQTLTLPIISVGGGGSPGGSIMIRKNGSTERKFPSASRSNPLLNGKVNVTVHSEYYQAWAQFFEQRTEGRVTVNHDNQTASIDLVIQGGAANVTSGVISGAPSSTLNVENNAEVDSYNSSDGPYPGFPANDSGTIVTAGDVNVDNNADIHGDVTTGGSAWLHNNGVIHGNLSYADSRTGGGTVTGWEANNATVAAPSSAAGIIDQKVTEFEDTNNNADPGVDIDETNKTLEHPCEPCEIDVAGDYYLESLTLNNNETLILDTATAGGDISIVVNGSISVDNSELIEVQGPHRVNMYVEGDATFGNDANVSVEGDRAPGFWMYLNPEATVDLTNGVHFTGVLYGPNGDNTGANIKMRQNARIFGAAVGELEILNQNVGIHYDEALTHVDPVQTGGSIPTITYLHVSVNRVNMTS